MGNPNFHHAVNEDEIVCPVILGCWLTPQLTCGRVHKSERSEPSFNRPSGAAHVIEQPLYLNLLGRTRGGSEESPRQSRPGSEAGTTTDRARAISLPRVHSVPDPIAMPFPEAARRGTAQAVARKRYREPRKWHTPRGRESQRLPEYAT